MNYIYCITNTINNKRYVGKTTQTLEERFKEHIKSSRKERCSKRPLYDAMSKYGIENFIIEELEQVEDETKLDEREIYWIQELQTYGSNGYNATKGGDGTILYDYNEIVDLYNLGYSILDIANKLHCDRSTITQVLKSKGIRSRRNSKIILQFDLAGNFIQQFDLIGDAVEWVRSNGLSSSNRINDSITSCCRGKIKSSYGYVWKYVSIT